VFVAAEAAVEDGMELVASEAGWASRIGRGPKRFDKISPTLQ
jgi:hypothetical protein